MEVAYLERHGLLAEAHTQPNGSPRDVSSQSQQRWMPVAAPITLYNVSWMLLRSLLESVFDVGNKESEVQNRMAVSNVGTW